MTLADYDDQHCNWCSKSVSDPWTEGGLWFCDEDCADSYYDTYGRDE